MGCGNGAPSPSRRLIFSQSALRPPIRCFRTNSFSNCGICSFCKIRFTGSNQSPSIPRVRKSSRALTSILSPRERRTRERQVRAKEWVWERRTQIMGILGIRVGRSQQVAGVLGIRAGDRTRSARRRHKPAQRPTDISSRSTRDVSSMIATNTFSISRPKETRHRPPRARCSISGQNEHCTLVAHERA
jgi:hypothetical protein